MDLIINTNSENSRIAKNTIVLYIRMFISLLLQLYLSRITLKYLGVDNYGIYNIVGGIVTLMTLLTAGFTSSSSRFLAFYLGRKDYRNLRKYFLTICNIHLLLAGVFFVLGEVVGIWMVNHYVSIPIDRLSAANIVLQCSLATTVFNLMTIPYNALITANEKMSFFAVVSIGNQILQLIMVLCLSFIIGDRLIWYSVFMFLISFTILSVDNIYCRSRFGKIVKYVPYFNKNIFKDLWSYVSWAYLGNFTGITKEHGVNIIIGHFFGVSVNAARAISMQVYNAVSAFGTNICVAINPQIIKTYARGDYGRSFMLVNEGTKFTFLLVFMMIIPIIFECGFILNLWLTEVPEHAILFCQLMLVLCLVRAAQTPVVNLYLAIGKIKESQIFSSITAVFCLVLTYILFLLGFSAEFSVLVSISLELVNYLYLMILLKRLINLDVIKFHKDTYLRPFIVVLLVVAIVYLFKSMMIESAFSSILVILFSVVLTLALGYFIGLNHMERGKLLNIIRDKLCAKQNS